MDAKFIKAVQDAGWHAEQIGKRQIVARCPAKGCGMRALLSSGSQIPKVDPDFTRSGLDRPVASYDDYRRILRERRENIGLRLHELEDVVGVATDYFAKAEKENPVKTPNFQTALDWAQALGYELVLRPASIDDGLALRVICDTRDKLNRRHKRKRVDRERRGPEARPYQEPDGRR